MQLSQLPCDMRDVVGIGHVLWLKGFGHKELLNPSICKSPKHLHRPNQAMLRPSALLVRTADQTAFPQVCLPMVLHAWIARS